MKNFYTLILLTVLVSDLIHCGPKSNKHDALSVISSIRDSIFLEQNGYGYDIIVNGKVKVHQPSIPGISGTSGFASAEDAQKIAQLAIDKIKNSQSPPSISLQELQCAGIIVYDYKSRSGLYPADM
jgi:hypothetical protein